MRTLIAASTALTCIASEACAREHHVFADVAVSTAVIDRGEQLAAGNTEITIGVESDAGPATLYGVIYRRTPIGNAHSAFDEEVDYAAGAVWAGEGVELDVSAAWLTFPGSQGSASLELAAAVTLDNPARPTLAGFYDVDTEHWGLEVLAGPEWNAGDWTLYALGRAGFVCRCDGPDARSYGGVEVGAFRQVSRYAQLGIYGRAELADRKSFVRRTGNGTVEAFRSSGTALGVILSLAH